VIQRNTAPARQVLVLAQQEARDLNHSYLDTEHLLLGLLAEGHGAAAQVLTSLGVSPDVMRDGVAARIGRGQQPPAEHVPLTPRSRKVLELTVREADRLGHDYFGTGHILLGLFREGRGVAVQLLVAHGVDMNLVREQVLQRMRDDPAGEGGYVRGGSVLAEEEHLTDAGTPLHVNWHKILPLLGAIEARLTAIEAHLGITPTAPEEG
jgi:ATP-dependent Clp protease ATP-binding subunit ClpC